MVAEPSAAVQDFAEKGHYNNNSSADLARSPRRIELTDTSPRTAATFGMHKNC